MSHIVLISCSSKKRASKAPARHLYASPLFGLNLRYAESIKPDAIYILSAKYGLIGLDEEVQPYDVTLNTMPLREVRRWADEVLRDLAEVSSLADDEFTFLAGIKYRELLVPHIRNYNIPLDGLRLGEQLRRLKELTV